MIVAGFGFRTGATRASLADALANADTLAGAIAGAPAGAKAGAKVAAFATVIDKASDPALVGLAAQNGVRVVAVPPDALTQQQTITHSQASQNAYGAGSVAEAAALAAAGPGARLLAPRAVSADRMATCALAQGDPK